jgi:hypothetical protein
MPPININLEIELFRFFQRKFPKTYDKSELIYIAEIVCNGKSTHNDIDYSEFKDFLNTCHNLDITAFFDLKMYIEFTKIRLFPEYSPQSINTCFFNKNGNCVIKFTLKDSNSSDCLSFRYQLLNPTHDPILMADEIVVSF